MSNFYVCYSDEAQNDLRGIFMHIAYELGSRDHYKVQLKGPILSDRHLLIGSWYLSAKD